MSVRVFSVLGVFLLIFSVGIAERSRDSSPDKLAEEVRFGDIVAWQPLVTDYQRLRLTISGPSGIYIQRVFENQSELEVIILTINTSDSPDRAREFVTKRKLTFPVLIDSNQKTANDYRIPGIPTTFFINSQGIIKAFKLGSFTSQTEIINILESL